MKNKEALLGLAIGFLLSWPINHAINQYRHRQFMLEYDESLADWAKHIQIESVTTNSQGNVTSMTWHTNQPGSRMQFHEETNELHKISISGVTAGNALIAGLRHKVGESVTNMLDDISQWTKISESKPDNHGIVTEMWMATVPQIDYQTNSGIPTTSAMLTNVSVTGTFVAFWTDTNGVKHTTINHP